MVGNSYTFGNGLGQMIEDLSASGGKNVTVSTRAVGGWWLRDHVNSPETTDVIRNGEWDYVVLQEQSVVPSVESERINSMNPSMRSLNNSIVAADAQVVLFLTWGRANGFSEVGHGSYGSMQAAVTTAYEKIADEVGGIVAPVGEVWKEFRTDHPTVALYQADGSHPTRAGSYLAAVVFYTVLFGESPEGLDYHGGLSDGLATTIQAKAAEVVLADPSRWHLDTP